MQLAEFKFVFKYSKYPNKQTKMTDNKIPKNINKILENKFVNNNERDRFSDKEL